MRHPAWTLGLLLRCAYYSCPKLATTLMLKTIVGGLGCEQGTSSGSLVPQRSLLLQWKEGEKKKKSTFWPLFFLFMRWSLEPKLLILFTLLVSASKSDHFVLMTVRGSPISYGSLLIALHGLMGKWSSQKRSIMEKEHIFHVNTILKVVRDRSGLPLVFKEKLPTEINEGLCFQINCTLLSLASGHGIKSDEPTKQHWAAPVNSHHQ